MLLSSFFIAMNSNPAIPSGQRAKRFPILLRFHPRHPLAAMLALFAVAPLRAAQPPSAPVTALKFQFGAEKAAPGYTLVPPARAYSKETGYGFEPGATLTVVTQEAGDPLRRGAVTAAQPFLFSVAVPEGNYRVTVTLGDPKADAVTTVKVETRRLMLERIRTAAGKFETRVFTVNVRGPKISTGGEVNLDSREMNLATHEPISRDWDDKLTLAFSDSHPALAALEIQKVDDAITIFVLGDSTVTDQPGGGGSWGQMFTRWFQPQVAIANHAESGETLKGFLKERRWDKVLDSLRPGDYVLIEFGCNDSKQRGPQNIYPGQDFSETYVPADTTYKDLLKQFAADVKKKGGFPVIVSPSARRSDVKKPTSLGAYADAAMAAAKEIGVPSIDLNSMGVDLNVALGADAGKQFADVTHHVEYGAYLQSKCIVLGIQRAKLPLAKYIVDDFGNFDPNHPEPLPARFDLPPDASSRGEERGARRGAARAAAPAIPSAPAGAEAPKAP
jgi:lysophospholipase L1-like esterase